MFLVIGTTVIHTPAEAFERQLPVEDQLPSWTRREGVLPNRSAGGSRTCDPHLRPVRNRYKAEESRENGSMEIGADSEEVRQF